MAGGAAIGALAASLIAVAISLSPQPNSAQPSFTFPKTIRVDLMIDSNLMEEVRMTINMDANKASQKEIPFGDFKGPLYNISLNMTPDPNNDLMNITIDACTMVDDQCVPTDQARLSIDTKPTVSSRASASTNLGNETFLNKDFYASTHRYEPTPTRGSAN